MHTTDWMIRSLLLCTLATSALPLARAQDIYKCVDGSATAYQSAPCPNGQLETRMTTGKASPRAENATPMSSSRPDEQPSRAEASAAPLTPGAAGQPSQSAAPWRRTTLTLGMSDDEVLNLPGWGRPTQITRSKLSRVWHEEWTYGQSVRGERRLHFANARLVDIVDKAAPDQIARLTLQ